VQDQAENQRFPTLNEPVNEAVNEAPNRLHELVACQLLERLRGRRSQLQLSRKLGFTSNVIYTWESGRRFPEVSNFFRIAELARVPVKERLLGFLGESARALRAHSITSPRTVASLVQLLTSVTRKSALAQRLAVDRGTLSRWVKGTTEPRLPEFLMLIETATQRLLPFIELFVDPAELDATREAHADLVAQQKLAYELPWSHAVLRALELRSYRDTKCHVVGVLAAQLGITIEDERRYLGELERSKQIRWNGSHWELGRVLTVDTREQPEKNRLLKLHWSAAALARLRANSAPESTLFSFNLFAVSDEGLQRIRELHLEYYDQVRSIIDQSMHADHVVLMNLQLVPLGADAAAGAGGSGK
jgi:transcriptional regulator with XRE-family HTH domain